MEKNTLQHLKNKTKQKLQTKDKNETIVFWSFLNTLTQIQERTELSFNI